VADEDNHLFVVADGMGGHRAGEVASRLAVETIVSFVRRSARDADFTWPFGFDPAASFDANRLRTAIQLANRQIFQDASARGEYNGMGTTVVSLLVNDATAAVAHVGDSRAYLLSNGSLQQLTADDSWAATVMAHDPGITAEQIARHPMRNVLTNVLGAREQVDIHMVERPLAPGEVLLLSSDGLHGALDHGAIHTILERTPEPQTAARLLVDSALARKTRDNVTALVVRCEADD
jgi:protein phosphatase